MLMTSNDKQKNKKFNRATKAMYDDRTTSNTHKTDYTDNKVICSHAEEHNYLLNTACIPETVD